MRAEVVDAGLALFDLVDDHAMQGGCSGGDGDIVFVGDGIWVVDRESEFAGEWESGNRAGCTAGGAAHVYLNIALPTITESTSLLPFLLQSPISARKIRNIFPTLLRQHDTKYDPFREQIHTIHQLQFGISSECDHLE